MPRNGLDNALMGVRAEQQAFAVQDLNYVIEHHLPEKLAAPKTFLP